MSPPTVEMKSPVDSTHFTTVVTSPLPRSATTSPYTHLIATPDSADQLLPIVREVNQQTMTTLMTLPSRSHTVLAEYLSRADTSHLSSELIAAYRLLLTDCGNTPAEADLKIREATSTRVYCRRSPRSPPTLNTPLPPEVEDVLRTRSPSPTVRFDETVNHCIRIMGVDNNVSIYQYDVSAAEASRAKLRGGYSPNRQTYTSLTREEANMRMTTEQTTPKRKLFGRRKQKAAHFVRDEFAPTVGIRRRSEVQETPLRYHTAVYHSGYSTRHPHLIERERHGGDEEIVDLKAEEDRKYPLMGKPSGSVERLEKADDLDARNLREYVRVYYTEKRGRGFPKPTALLHKRSQYPRRQEQHQNGHAQLDSTAVQRTTPRTFREGEVQKVRRYRIFTRERHEGEEQIIEDVDLSAYPRIAASTSAEEEEGPVRVLERIDEVETQPLQDHAAAYSSGFSSSATKTTDESASPRSEEEAERQKRTAVLHLKKQREEKKKKSKSKRPTKDDQQASTSAYPQPSERYDGELEDANKTEEIVSSPLRDYVEEVYQVSYPRRPQSPLSSKKEETEVRRSARIHLKSPTCTEEPEEQQEEKGGLFGFLKKRERKAEDRPVEYPTGPPFEGPYETVRPDEQLAPATLRSHVQPYHSGYSTIFGCHYRFFTRERHEGEEEEAAPDLAAYTIDDAHYEGPLEEIGRDAGEVEKRPLQQSVRVYHSGHSFVRPKRKGGKKKATDSSSESGFEETLEGEDEEEHTKRIARLHVRSAVPEVSQQRAPAHERRPLLGFLQRGRKEKHGDLRYPPPSDRFEGPLNELHASELLPSPLREHVEEVHAISYPTHAKSPIPLKSKGEEGEERKKTAQLHIRSEVVEQPEEAKSPTDDQRGLFAFLKRKEKHEEEPTTTAYPDEDRWERELTPLHPSEEVASSSLQDHVDAVFDVSYSPLSRRTNEPKGKAVIHTKTIEGTKGERRPESFVYLQERQEDESNAYPVQSVPLEGQLETVERTTEIPTSPLREHVEEVHEVDYSEKKGGEMNSPSEEHRGLLRFLKKKGKDEDKWSSYPLLSDRYKGPLDDLRPQELSTSPLREHIDRVHDIPYGQKKKTEEEETEVHKTAAIYSKTTIVEDTEGTKRPVEEHRGLFGFLKKKPEEEGIPRTASFLQMGQEYTGDYDLLNPDELSTSPLKEHVEEVQEIPYSPRSLSKQRPTPASYPQMGEQWEGDVDSMHPFDFSPSPLREHVQQVPEVPYSPPTKRKVVTPPVGEEFEVHKTAVIHARRSVIETPEEEAEGGKSKLFGIFRKKEKHQAEEEHPSTSSLPQIGEKWEGEVDSLHPFEFTPSPLREHVDQVHDIAYPSPKRQASKSEVIPAYPSTSERFEGPFDELHPEELSSSPLREYVDQVNDIPYGQKKIEEVEGETRKQTAKIHTKSTSVEIPSGSPKSERKSKRFGFFSRKDEHPAAYLQSGEKYEGALVEVTKADEMPPSPLRDHVQVVQERPHSPIQREEEELSAKRTARLLIKRNEEELVTPKRKKAKRTPLLDEQQPTTSAHVKEEETDVALSRKPIARLLLRSDEQPKEKERRVKKPATRGIMKRLFGRKRTTFDVRDAAVRVGRDESSEMVGVMTIGDASFFTSERAVRNVEVNLFARRMATAAYHVEILVADLSTRIFPVVFGGRRGPVCLPLSYMLSTVDHVFFTPSTSGEVGDGFNRLAKPPLDEREDEEADASSMASADVGADRPKKHKRHHRPSAHESEVKLQQLSPPQPEEKKQKERSKSKHDTSSSSSSSSVEVEERHHVLHSEEKTEHTKRTERSTAFASNDPPKHTNDPQRMESSGWGAVGGGHQTSLSPFTALPISAASPLQTDEFVEESETISSKVITTGNRTVETVTYTTKKDGVENTRVEHRVTVNEEPDSEAAVKRAIAEATGLRSYQVHGLAVPVHQHE